MDLSKDDEQRNNALRNYDENTRHLCIRQETLVPCRPILTPQEEKQFDR
jgi:hypothetical protein